MYTADPVMNITTVLTSGAVVLSDADYDYRYGQLTVLGASTAITNITLNGAVMDLGGTIVMPTPIYSLVVNSGAGVSLSGTRSAKTIFGNFSSSSEGLT